MISLTHRIGFDEAAALLPYRLQSRLHRCTSHATLPIVFVDDKAADSPYLVCSISKGESSILLSIVGTRTLFSEPILAPSYRFSRCINKDPVGTTLLDELCFLAMVSHRSLGSGPRLLILR